MPVRFHAGIEFEERATPRQPKRGDGSRNIDESANSSGVHCCWRGPRATHRVSHGYWRRRNKGFVEELWKLIGKCCCSRSGKKPRNASCKWSNRSCRLTHVLTITSLFLRSSTPRTPSSTTL